MNFKQFIVNNNNKKGRSMPNVNMPKRNIQQFDARYVSPDLVVFAVDPVVFYNSDPGLLYEI